MASAKVIKVLRMREGSQTQRCHLIPHSCSYDVAQHSFGMMVLLDVLYPQDDLHAKADLHRAILYHDLHERWTGDLPFAAKRMFPELKAQHAGLVIARKTGIVPSCLDNDQSRWLKSLDHLEFFMWCDDQFYVFGNTVARIHGDRTKEIMLNELELPSEVEAFLEEYEWQRTSDNLD